MEMVAAEESNGARHCVIAPGISALPVELRSRDAETDDKPKEEGRCDHFSIRGYVALVQKKDPKFCSLSQIFHGQQQYDEHHSSLCPLSVEKFRRWDCPKCLDKMKNTDHRATPRAVFTNQDGTSNCCSISFIRSALMPTSVGCKGLFPCTQQSSQEKNVGGSTLLKSAQESNSKCCSPSSDKKGVTEANTDPAMEDLQVSLNNHGVTVSISNSASVDVTPLPEAPRMRANKEGIGMEIPCSPKLSEVILKPNADENGRTQEILIVNCNTNNVPKRISGHKGDEVCKSGPRGEAPSKRSVRSNSKKKHNKPTALASISDVKFCQKKPKKVRLLSEIINTDQGGGSRSDLEADHEKVAGLCEDDGSIMPLALRNSGIPVSHQTVGEIRSKTIKNKKKYKGLDVVDDGSSLMNWLKRSHKKLRTEKKDSEFKDFGSTSANSKSTMDISASKDMHHENIQNVNLERNMKRRDDLCQNESEHSTQRCLSKVKTMSLSKREMPPTASAQHGDENTENISLKRNIHRTDDVCQMESESSMQRYLGKVSPRKRDIQNVTGLHEQKQPKKKKKQKPELRHEKQTIIDDIPMDIVELLAKKQQERQLMTENDSFGTSHTRSKITADDRILLAAEDGPNNASTVPDTNFQQKSLGSGSKQKALQDHMASSTQSTSIHPLKLPIPDHFLCSEEQQTHLHMEEVVTIARSSPTFSQHEDQYISEAPAESWSHKGTKKSMWHPLKTATRDSSTETCVAQFRPNVQVVDLTFPHVTQASNHYPSHQPVITALNHCTKRAANQVQARSFPSTVSTMESGNLCDRRIAGQSGLYPKETMPATHLLRLMDSSTLAGFPNYETPNRNQMEFQFRNSYYTHNQYNGSTNTSYGSNLNQKVPFTLEDLPQHQFHQNLHKPFRPLPRVGVLGSLLQKEIANWSENCGTQSGYRIGVSKGITSFEMNTKDNFETLNSGMFSAKWNALQLNSVANPELLSARGGLAQSWTRGKGKMAHPLDKFVRQDICVTNRNPADFTTISDDNEYMINL